MWTALAFAVVGTIHLMPIAPVFVPEMLTRLYGITPGDTTLLVLLRHRALLPAPCHRSPSRHGARSVAPPRANAFAGDSA